MARPDRLVAVVGTGTDVGKTWVAARLIRGLREAGSGVAARKPAQSFDAADDPSGYDAAVLGGASGERPETVCPRHRWYEVAMAPPMAAEVLGRPAFSVADLLDECRWPEEPVDVGLVETAGGLRSPIAQDGDCLLLARGLAPDLVVLVADAGLGTINAVRLTTEALTAIDAPMVIVLNRFDQSANLHRRNLAWLRERDGLSVLVTPGDEEELGRRVCAQG
ncbi:MAG TPA: dethiobiotin synthase [Acidimicrobiales bacterium]